MSAMASGTRGASLKMLNKISRILDISLDDLVKEEERRLVFKNENLEEALDNIERSNYDGMDKSWVNRVMLAQKTHYKKARKVR